MGQLDGPPQKAPFSALLPSAGALTLISKVTGHANDSMEQGVSPAAGPFSGVQVQDPLSPAQVCLGV